MFKLDLEKAEEPEIKLPTSTGLSKKQEFQKHIYFCFIDYAKAFDHVNQTGKFFKRWECQTTWPASSTSHIHTWVLFLLWLHLFILYEFISPLISSNTLGSYWLGNSSFSILSFGLFILFMGFSRQEYWSGLPFPSPVDRILSELSTMTRLSWVALHSMAYCFIE